MNNIAECRSGREKNRHLIRFIFAASLILCEAAVFYLVWTGYYNPALRTPYLNKGNYFVTLIYAVLLILFQRVYGGSKLGYYRPVNLFISLSVSAVVANIVTYIAVIIPAATWYLSPVPAVVLMSLVDIAAALIWSFAGSRVFLHLIPPQRLLLFYGSETDDIAAKFASRRDRFLIEKRIYAGTQEFDAEVLCTECSAYDGVIIGDLPSPVRNDIIKYCYARRIRTYTLPKISDIILQGSETLHIFDTPLYLNRNHGMTFSETALKRAFDIVASACGLILLLPLFLITAACIWLEDHGPVFFLQERYTKGCRSFQIIKFRSMIVDAEKLMSDTPATEKDPRITKTGAVIRALRIDELPQLINILIGDMSIVGPRPEKRQFVEEFCEKIPEYSYRYTVRGGLTGYAQVYGKYNTMPYHKLQLDLMYIENYSFLLDLEIILKTLQIVLTKESSEGFQDKENKDTADSKGKDAADNEGKDGAAAEDRDGADK